MSEKTILLDMDGVVVDFVGGCCEAFDQDPASLDGWMDSGRGWRFFEAWGLTESDFWATIDRQGESFWEYLQPLPWARQLFDGLTQLAPVYFCSSAALTPYAWSGKVKWLREFVGIGHFNDIVLTTHKHLLARPSNCLVDDNEANEKAFLLAGGHAVLFPQRWNRRAGHDIELAMEEVERWVLG